MAKWSLLVLQLILLIGSCGKIVTISSVLCDSCRVWNLVSESPNKLCASRENDDFWNDSPVYLTGWASPKIFSKAVLLFSSTTRNIRDPQFLLYYVDFEPQGKSQSANFLEKRLSEVLACNLHLFYVEKLKILHTQLQFNVSRISPNREKYP